MPFFRWLAIAENRSKDLESIFDPMQLNNHAESGFGWMVKGFPNFSIPEFINVPIVIGKR
jgi:hypothetical protein